MTSSAKPVGDNRFRASYGRYFEDFEVGHVYEHRPGRTVTETDNTWFTLLTMNQHPLHFDTAYAAQSEFGRPLVNSAFTLALVTGMSVADVSQKAVANLGWTDIRMPAPVFVGDTLYAESEVLARRESKSRPTAGIVTVRTTGRKLAPDQAGQDPAQGTVVIVFERTMLVPRRGQGADDRAHY